MTKRRLEKQENYNITTEVTEEVEKWVQEVMGSKEFYDFVAPLMYRYLAKKEKAQHENKIDRNTL
ncbi:hypothetical protein [Bacillus atrophaeus]|uniref:hypothetical protein n=1 Tax=Bacillus atrophaeus TaxID=1452 RepID=UPI002E1ED44B|nr:hypothetical protein [Bacillus atrophaeus]MED4816386.1 hypothetical protein [Bacillus atrophaeus]MED4823209.1 hypothetical protein [Bacillus atrophaeus]MED4842759.1 hypothetical protein [Bacillus atrophaeus]